MDHERMVVAFLAELRGCRVLWRFCAHKWDKDKQEERETNKQTNQANHWESEASIPSRVLIFWYECMSQVTGLT